MMVRGWEWGWDCAHGQPSYSPLEQKMPTKPCPAFRSLVLCALMTLVLTMAACGGGGAGQIGEGTSQPLEVVTEPVRINTELKRELDFAGAFQLGIEVEERAGYPNLRNRRLTLYVNSASVDSRGQHTLEKLLGNVQISVARVVLVEDGTTSRSATLDRILASNRQLSVWSLSAEQFRPVDGMFRHSDLIVWDVPLTGHTNSLEVPALGAALERASLTRRRMVVLDRPPLITPDYVEGAVSDLILAGTRDAFLPLPLLPGATSVELARLYNESFGIGATVDLVPMIGWRRRDGNRWLHEPQWELSEDRRARLAEVAALQPFHRGWPELQSLRQLLGDGAFSHREIAAREGGYAELILLPVQVPALAVAERLASIRLPGLQAEPVVRRVDGEDVMVLVVRKTENNEPVHVMESSLALRLAASRSPREIPDDSTADTYKNSTLLPSLRRGITPEQLRRRWTIAPEYLTFMANREKVLLYEP